MRLFLFSLLAVSFFASAIAQNKTVFTQRYDNRRSSWNDQETILTPSNVTPKKFGLLFTRPVDDQIYAQPLVVANLNINGATRNVVFVATVNNTLYAFNATDSSAMTPLWKANFTPSGSRVIKNTDMTGACGGNYRDFSGNMGIVGTPVIDTVAGTLFVVSRDIITATSKFEQYLHAIDIKTGKEKANSPALLTASVAGTGDGSVSGVINFDPQKQNQRPGLLLLNGVVYVAWASHCDWGPYHGWVIGYDGITLQRKYTYNDTPDGYNGGIWMSGAGPVVDDDGYIYVTTGNGSVGKNGAAGDPRNRGESLLKLKPSGSTLALINFFTPRNYAYLEQYDLDYGVDGCLLIPNTSLSLSGSKEGKLYVVDTKKMGGYTPLDDSVKQVLYVNTQNIGDKHIHGTPVYYRYTGVGQVDSEYVYVWAESDSMSQFVFNRQQNQFDIARSFKGKIKLDYGMPGAMLTISSAGKTSGTGVIWAAHAFTGDANQSLRPGVLEAFDARDVRKVLYRSSDLPNRDGVGLFAKFNHPVVANGKVYVPTFSNQLNVYGLLPSSRLLGTDDLNSLLEKLVIYPNPTSSIATIEYTLQESVQSFSVRITDMLGRSLVEKKLDNSAGTHRESILLSNLGKGIYTLFFYADGRLMKSEKLEKL